LCLAAAARAGVPTPLPGPRRAGRVHDRGVVVFGSWHVLALEPVLDQAFAR
jgi:hypothetical protein